jgi:ribose-phosphate pyrophosphokinase
MPNGLRVFSGTGNPALASEICTNLGIQPGAIKIKQFADGELFPEIQENVRGCDVFIVQPTCAPANDHLMELILMIDAFKRASADRITAVLPYYGYARQDRKDRPRVPISAAAVANMIESAGADRVVAMDLHSAPIGGFFKIPVDHLYALPVFVDDIRKSFDVQNLTVVSPDAGGVARARLLAGKLGAPMAIVDKHREAANVSEVMHVIGEENVKGRDCLMVDDMIDTAGTLCKGALALMKRGAKSVRGCATHGVLSYDSKENINAVDRIEESVLQEVMLANTIPFKFQRSKIRFLSVASLLAKGIEAIHNDTSISDLFI